jgi:predicted RNA-binding protein with PUA-like domain
MKSEPGEFSIDDLAASPRKTAWWTGVRNYQARNFMRDEMRIGDLAFFYHSSTPQTGIVGIVEITREATPDTTQFDPESDDYDPKATLERPRWFHVAVTLKERFPRIALATLRSEPELQSMRLLRRGNRLSITPITEKEWRLVNALREK